MAMLKGLLGTPQQLLYAYTLPAQHKMDQNTLKNVCQVALLGRGSQVYNKANVLVITVIPRTWLRLWGRPAHRSKEEGDYNKPDDICCEGAEGSCEGQRACCNCYSHCHKCPRSCWKRLKHQACQSMPTRGHYEFLDGAAALTVQAIWHWHKLQTPLLPTRKPGVSHVVGANKEAQQEVAIT